MCSPFGAGQTLGSAPTFVTVETHCNASLRPPTCDLATGGFYLPNSPYCRNSISHCIFCNCIIFYRRYPSVKYTLKSHFSGIPTFFIIYNVVECLFTNFAQPRIFATINIISVLMPMFPLFCLYLMRYPRALAIVSAFCRSSSLILILSALAISASSLRDAQSTPWAYQKPILSATDA